MLEDAPVVLELVLSHEIYNKGLRDCPHHMYHGARGSGRSHRAVLPRRRVGLACDEVQVRERGCLHMRLGGASSKLLHGPPLQAESVVLRRVCSRHDVMLCRKVGWAYGPLSRNATRRAWYRRWKITFQLAMANPAPQIQC